MIATKADKKMLKLLARQLPVTTYRANQSRIVDAEEYNQSDSIGKQGIEKLPEGTKANVTKSVMLPVNHERRIVKAFEIGGMKAVKEYCEGVRDLTLQTAKHEDETTRQEIFSLKKLYLWFLNQFGFTTREQMKEAID